MATSLFENEVQRLLTEWYTKEEADNVASTYINFLYPKAQKTSKEVAYKHDEIWETLNIDPENTKGKKTSMYQDMIDYFEGKNVNMRQIAKRLWIGQKRLLDELLSYTKEIKNIKQTPHFIDTYYTHIGKKVHRNWSISSMADKYMNTILNGKRIFKHWSEVRKIFFRVWDNMDEYIDYYEKHM